MHHLLPDLPEIMHLNDGNSTNIVDLIAEEKLASDQSLGYFTTTAGCVYGYSAHLRGFIADTSLIKVLIRMLSKTIT